jgi:hypothetical protein
MAKKTARKFYPLDHKKHGVGGVVMKPFKPRKQDRRAKPAEFFCVVFFPTITQIGNASLAYPRIYDTFAQTSETAKAKFLDNMAKGEKWDNYHKAGHRIRRVRISDLGDAALGE